MKDLTKFLTIAKNSKYGLHFKALTVVTFDLGLQMRSTE